jgi:hypothetical protein
MIDFDILTEAGTTNERLRRFFTAKMPGTEVVARKLAKLDKKEARKYKAELRELEKDVKRRKDYEDKLASILQENVVFSLQQHSLYGAVDLAWDGVPINRAIFPLLLYAQGRIKIGEAIKSLQQLPDGQKYIRKNDDNGTVSIDLPKFTEMNINLVRSVITRRLAAQENKYGNLWPHFKYESRTAGPTGKLREELVSQKMDIMADQFDYKTFEEQMKRDLFLYTRQVAFPRCAWEREVQWHKKDQAVEFEATGTIAKKSVVVKEGICWTRAHPSRLIWDNNYPLTSLNTDTGCEYVGFWDVMRWGDIANNPAYFNRDSVAFSADTAAWFNHYSTYFNQYFDVITPPTVPDNDATATNDRKNNTGIYNGEMAKSATFFTHIFLKEKPQDWGWGTYPHPVWVHLCVAGDATVVYAEIMPSSPASVWSHNENDSRLVNLSMAHELMQYQDQLTNLFSQLLETIKADLFSIAILNTDIFPDTDDGKKALNDFRATMEGVNFYASTQILEASFAKFHQVGIDIKSADNIFKIVRSSTNEKISDIFRSITTLIAMAERMMALSPQEQGQPAPHEISATESRQLGDTTETMAGFISTAIDRGRAAMKRICYESWIAKGEDQFELPVVTRFPTEIITKAGLQVVGENELVVRGSKLSLVHDYIFTSRDGGDRVSNTEGAKVLVELIGRMGQMVPEAQRAVLGAMGKQKLFDIYNEVFRLAQTSVDLNLTVRPGEDDNLLIEDDEQVMQLLARLGQATAQNTEQIQQIMQLLGSNQLSVGQPASNQ